MPLKPKREPEERPETHGEGIGRLAVVEGVKEPGVDAAVEVDVFGLQGAGGQECGGNEGNAE